jgi:two-component system phosphate regulon sensor histidine kinase PhoR
MFEKKEVELKYEMMDLKNIVNDVVSSMRLQLEKYKANILVSGSGDTVLQADMLHVQSVVFNLLDNALKYSKGEPEIRVNVEGRDNEVELSVADNGIGIPEEYQGKVFEKFFRIPHGNTHNAKGYGLGLSYVAHVVEKHKGTIRLESQEGKGSKFIITLPKNNS